MDLESLITKIGMHLIPLGEGKVRHAFRHPYLPRHRGVLVTDRISSHDYVLGFLIPRHGEIRNASTVYWKRKLADRGILTDLIYAGVDIDEIMPAPLVGIPELWKRFTWVREAEMDLVENIGRNRLAGSALGQYNEHHGVVYGQQLPEGLKRGSFLSTPLWTPTTKAPPGEHDMPMLASEVDRAFPLHKPLTLKVLGVMNEETQNVGAAEYVDTKLEFGRVWLPGRDKKELAVCDEIGSFDSSRIWRTSDVALLQPGELAPPVDKDWLRKRLEVLGIKDWDPGNPEHQAEVRKLRLSPEEHEELETLCHESFEITADMSLDEFQRDELKIPK